VKNLFVESVRRRLKRNCRAQLRERRRVKLSPDTLLKYSYCVACRSRIMEAEVSGDTVTLFKRIPGKYLIL